MRLFTGVGFDAANNTGHQTSDSSAGSAKVLGRQLQKCSDGKQGNIKKIMISGIELEIWYCKMEENGTFLLQSWWMLSSLLPSWLAIWKTSDCDKQILRIMIVLFEGERCEEYHYFLLVVVVLALGHDAGCWCWSSCGHRATTRAKLEVTGGNKCEIISGWSCLWIVVVMSLLLLLVLFQCGFADHHCLCPHVMSWGKQLNPMVADMGPLKNRA